MTIYEIGRLNAQAGNQKYDSYSQRYEILRLIPGERSLNFMYERSLQLDYNPLESKRTYDINVKDKSFLFPLFCLFKVGRLDIGEPF